MRKLLALAASLLLSLSAFGQVTVGTTTGNAPPLQIAVNKADPATCSIGQLNFRSDLTAGQNLKGCTSANTWTVLGDGAAAIGSTVTSGTAGSVLFVGAGPVLAQDNTNFNYTTSSGPRLQVGSGSTTSAGWVAGYGALSGISALWHSGGTLTDYSTAVLFANTLDTYIRGPNQILFQTTTGTKIAQYNTAGQGPSITAGTATTDVAALSVTQTWNNAAAATGVKIAITDTTSAAGALPLQVLGGASATTNLLSLGKTGQLVVGDATDGRVTTKAFVAYNGSDYGAILQYATSGVFGGVIGGLALSSANGVVWDSTTSAAAGSEDSGLSRISAGIIGVGTGAAGSIAGGIQLASIGLRTGIIADSATAPTIASGFGTSPSVVANNGTAAFTINVGTGGTASAGVVTLPAATTGWDCKVSPNGAPQAAAITYSAPTSTTSVTITNYTLATGAALAWAASTVLNVNCRGY